MLGKTLFIKHHLSNIVYKVPYSECTYNLAFTENIDGYKIKTKMRWLNVNNKHPSQKLQDEAQVVETRKLGINHSCTAVSLASETDEFNICPQPCH